MRLRDALPGPWSKQLSQYRVSTVQMRSALGQAEAATRSQMLLEETCGEEEKQPVAVAVEHSFDPEELNNGVLALQAAVRRRFARDTTTRNETGSNAGGSRHEERGAARGTSGRAQNKGRGGGKGKGRGKGKPEGRGVQ